jgi:heparosan-N-sulfate-glucuronate 5-epimerase
LIIDNISSIAIYFNPRFISYWDKITPCCISERPSSLGRYYLDFSSKYYYKKFDNDGIPIYKKGQQKYHPTVICQYALGAFELYYRSGYDNKLFKNNFLKQVNWLIFNMEGVTESLGWKLKFVIKEYDLTDPWFSALTQGEAISILLRAYMLDKKEKYLISAEKALRIFEVPVKDGGILNYYHNYPIYEEYPSVKTNCVLNGFIFSLFGLYDFIVFNQNKKARRLFHEGVDSLIKLLPEFDTQSWSQYNLYNSPRIYSASYKYHLIHIEQLKALFYLTGHNDFLLYADKWKRYSLKLKDRLNELLKKIKE